MRSIRCLLLSALASWFNLAIEAADAGGATAQAGDGIPQAGAQAQADAAFRSQYGIPRPVWASQVATDSHGLWADLTVAGTTQRFRWIKPGQFTMGSPADEIGRTADEETQHAVRLTQGFWLADSETPQGLWQAVMGQNPAKWQDANRPVDTVSWSDAQDFLAALNRLVPGLAARLPTEAQWEYACRAGSTSAFTMGADIAGDQVNFDSTIPLLDSTRKSAWRGKTTTVKSFAPNAWGLYDMHGNVWEWCADWSKWSVPADPVTDPAGPVSGSHRIIRGGSWRYGARGCRSAHRTAESPNGRRSDLGLRILSEASVLR